MSLRLVRILYVVELVWRGLPDLNEGAGDRVRGPVSDATFHPKRFAGLRPQQDALAGRQLALPTRVERAEHRGLC